MQVVKHIAPAVRAFNRAVVYAQHFTRPFLRHAQDHVKRLRRGLLLPEDLDVDTVHEHDRIVSVKPPDKPCGYFLPDVVNHPRDAGLAVVLAVYLVEDLSYLRLRQSLRIQAPSELLALFLLVP